MLYLLFTFLLTFCPSYFQSVNFLLDFTQFFSNHPMQLTASTNRGHLIPSLPLPNKSVHRQIHHSFCHIPFIPSHVVPKPRDDFLSASVTSTSFKPS